MRTHTEPNKVSCERENWRLNRYTRQNENRDQQVSARTIWTTLTEIYAKDGFLAVLDDCDLRNTVLMTSPPPQLEMVKNMFFCNEVFHVLCVFFIFKNQPLS